jgi:glycerophosphoryl diester phosphodiesterase
MLERWYPGRPLLLGHRGDRARTPENSIESVHAAMEAGADGVEFDVRLSRDGVPMVIHDDTVERVSLGWGRVESLTADELSNLELRRHPRWGAALPARVPRLAELLGALPDDAAAFVEIKRPEDHRGGVERAVLQAIEPHRARLRVIVSSFATRQLHTLRRLDPSLPLGLLVAENQIMPLRSGLAALAIRPAALHLPVRMVEPTIVRRAHLAGIRVHAWDVLHPEVVGALVDSGVDAIMVDDVRAGRRALDLALSARPPREEAPRPQTDPPLAHPRRRRRRARAPRGGRGGP